eukprot:657031-Prorocentrum_minimum.AAC.2
MASQRLNGQFYRRRHFSSGLVVRVELLLTRAARCAAGMRLVRLSYYALRVTQMPRKPPPPDPRWHPPKKPRAPTKKEQQRLDDPYENKGASTVEQRKRIKKRN